MLACDLRGQVAGDQLSPLFEWLRVKRVGVPQHNAAAGNSRPNSGQVSAIRSSSRVWQSSFFFFDLHSALDDHLRRNLC